MAFGLYFPVPQISFVHAFPSLQLLGQEHATEHAQRPLQRGQVGKGGIGLHTEETSFGT